MLITAVTTTMISLLVLGIFLILVYNVNNIGEAITSQVEITAFLNKNIDNSQLNELRKELSNISQVREIEYVSPDSALSKLGKDLGINLRILADENPLPPALIIRAITASEIPQIVERINKIQEIEEIKYGESILRKILTISIIIKFVGFMLVILMGIGTLFTVMNTIRLTVITRRTEIKIMQLVGATGWFIRWPFLFEGIFIGLTASIITVIVLTAGYYLFARGIQNAVPFVFPLISFYGMSKVLFMLLMTSGILMGFTGSYISVGKFLDEET